MVSREEVEQVAANASIKVSGDEEFTSDLEKILEMFSKLEEIDTGEVEPAFHPVEVEAETREDEEEDCLDREETFRNTENEEDGKFKGPSV